MTTRSHLPLAAAFLAVLLVAGCSNRPDDVQPIASDNVAKLQVTSGAFADGQPIPDKCTCHGADFSPPLQWTGAPAQAKCFAVTCEDPDAPGGTFTHWVIYNLPATNTALQENLAKTATLQDGSKQGK